MRSERLANQYLSGTKAPTPTPTAPAYRIGMKPVRPLSWVGRFLARWL